MDYSSFLEMKAELSLVAVMVILLIYDLFAGEKGMRWFQPLACILVAAQILYNIVPTGNVEILGGMYQSTPMASVLKTILTIGTLIVFLQARNWLERDAIIRRGEFSFPDALYAVGYVFHDFGGQFHAFLFRAGNRVDPDGYARGFR